MINFTGFRLVVNLDGKPTGPDSILQHYGYSINKKDSKKPHSLIAINLVSPKLDYTSYGKSRIDFSPS